LARIAVTYHLIVGSRAARGRAASAAPRRVGG